MVCTCWSDASHLPSLDTSEEDGRKERKNKKKETLVLKDNKLMLISFVYNKLMLIRKLIILA